jgi:hypothetical protein
MVPLIEFATEFISSNDIECRLMSLESLQNCMLSDEFRGIVFDPEVAEKLLLRPFSKTRSQLH